MSLLQRVLSSDLWIDLGVEAYWKYGLRPYSRPVPTWMLNPDHLIHVTIQWPAKYDWKYKARWLDPLVEGFRRYVRVVKVDIPQVRNITIVRFLYRDFPYYIVIDSCDYLDFIDEEWAQRCLLYFKMQYAATGYSNDRILPGNFVSHSGELYDYLPYLRNIRDDKSYLADVYTRFSFEFARNLREQIHAMLLSQTFKYIGGPRKVRYSRFLREAAHAKICIDVPGNADVCCRLVDYLAIGACIIGLKPRTIFHPPIVDREHIVYTNPDLSDLAGLCRYYLEHEHERERISQNSRTFFEKYLHRDQIAAYYLSKFLEQVV
jgi:hypothetical protein